MLILFQAVFTGLAWTAIGIVLNRCSRNDFDVAAYSIIQSFSACLLCLFFYADLHRSYDWQNCALMIFVILSAAALNALAQNLVKYAMSCGGNAVAVWALAQASMIFPFMTGRFILGGYAVSVWNWSGIFLLLAGVFLPAIGCFRSVRKWFVPAFSAMLVYGLFQSMYLIPSHRLFMMEDPGTLRPALVCFGNLIGWSLVSSVRTERIHFSRKAVIAALVMAAVHTVSVRTFFYVLDGFSAMHQGGLAMPLMLGINLAGFGIYSMIFIKEKRRLKDAVSVALIIAGLLFLGIQTAR